MHPDTELERKLERILLAVLRRGDHYKGFDIEWFSGEPFFGYDGIRFSLATLAKDIAVELKT